MSLVNPKKMFIDANKNKYAIGAFNFVNLETLKGIMEGAKRAKKNILVACSEGAINYMGINNVMGLVNAASKDYPEIDFALHLDHGKDFEICKKCIDAGFTSVMIDASSLPLTENIKVTKEVATYAHANNVFCEGELGRISGIEDLINVKTEEAYFTSVDEATQFIKETGVDSLAISIGTSHGAYKIATTKNLHIDIVEKIKKENKNIFLVLHGASSINKETVEKINSSGGCLKETSGVPESEIKKAIKAGINKVNIDSDIRLAFTIGVRQTLNEKKAEFDIRNILKPAIQNIATLVENKIMTVLN